MCKRAEDCWRREEGSVDTVAKVFEGEVGLEIRGVGLGIFEVRLLAVLEIFGRGTVAASSQTSRGINICWTNIIRSNSLVS